MTPLACAAFIAALPLAGCAVPPLAPGQPKEVRGHPMPPYEILEECFAMDEGDEVRWRFTAEAPLDFDIRYRDGKAEILPLVKERVSEDAGRYVALTAQRYCLAWEAKAQGTLLDYRIELGRSGR
jgi:hypothetical protein